MSNRAVSNTLGYVLLFGVVFMSLTLVGTLGVDSMENARDQTVQLNGERTMTGIGSALEDIHRENVTRRTSRVNLGRGTLSPGAESEISVSIDGNPIVDETLEPLVYRVGDSRFIYEAGAVFLVRGDGARVVESPSMVLDDGSGGYIIPIVNTTAASDGSVSGSNAQVIMTRVGGQTKIETSGNIEIDIETTETRAPLWKEMLKEAGAGGCDPVNDGDESVSCSYTGGSTIVVHSTEIRYEILT